MILAPRLNEIIKDKTRGLVYNVNEIAPDTYDKLRGNAGILTVWDGASDNTIYADPAINWAFRAWHDKVHLKYDLDFSIESELILAKLAASQFDGKIADIVYAEVGGLVEYFRDNGRFPTDQAKFVKEYAKVL